MSTIKKQADLCVRLDLGSVQSYNSFPLKGVSVLGATPGNSICLITLHPDIQQDINRNRCEIIYPQGARLGSLRINMRSFWISEHRCLVDGSRLVTVTAASAAEMLKYLHGYGNPRVNAWVAVGGRTDIVEAWQESDISTHLLLSDAPRQAEEVAV